MSFTETASLSRRTALIRVGGGGLAAAFAARALGAAAQDASPMAGEVPPLLEEWADAFSAEDLDRVMALFTDDAVFEEIPTGTLAEGKDAVRAAIGASLDALDEVELTVTAGFRAGDWAAAEGTFGGQYTGALPGLPPGIGQAFEVRYAAIFELEGDLIRRETDYFDLYSLLIQLGVIPPPGRPAEATPSA